MDLLTRQAGSGQGVALEPWPYVRAHTGCVEPAHEAGGRYCGEHGLELAVVLAMLDEMWHVPDYK